MSNLLCSKVADSRVRRLDASLVAMLLDGIIPAFLPVVLSAIRVLIAF